MPDDREQGTVEMMERFSTLVAQGVDPAVAYIESGYGAGGPCGSLASQHAMELLRDEVISGLIADIRSNQPVVTRDWVLNSLRENFYNAVAHAKFSAANKSLELIGREIGMFRNLKTGESRKRLEDMSAEELKSFVSDIESEITRVGGSAGPGEKVTLQ